MRSVLALVLTVVLLCPAADLAAQGADRLLPLLIDLPGFEAKAAERLEEVRSTMAPPGVAPQGHAIARLGVTRSYQPPSRIGSIEASLGTGLPAMVRVAIPTDTARWQTISGFRVATIPSSDPSRVRAVVVPLSDRNAILVLEFDNLDMTADRALELARRFDWSSMREQVRALGL